MIGLFGGSFDPIHHGHLIAARVLAETLELDAVWFVPARAQPFKVGRHGAGAAARAEMVTLAIDGEPTFRLERAELDGPAVSYTVETLRALRTREPGRDFALLLGADAAAELPGWREAEAIPGLAQVVAFGRAGAATPAGGLVSRVVSVPAIAISATQIRGRVAAGRSIRYFVPEAVAAYIATQGLYRESDG